MLKTCRNSLRKAWLSALSPNAAPHNCQARGEKELTEQNKKVMARCQGKHQHTIQPRNFETICGKTIIRVPNGLYEQEIYSLTANSVLQLDELPVLE